MNKVALVLALAACGNKQDAPSVDITDAHLAAVKAASPTDGKIEWEIGKAVAEKGKKKSYKLVRPKGWKSGFMPGSLEPADADNFGSKTLGKTSLRVDSNCDGACEEKDWAKVADKVNFARFATAEGKIVKDEKGTNERTVVFEHKPSEHFPEKDVAVTVVRAWWQDGGSKYFTCEAEVGTPVKDYAKAFELACSKVSGD